MVWEKVVMESHQHFLVFLQLMLAEAAHILVVLVVLAAEE
jgi:hypothetical protein